MQRPELWAELMKLTPEERIELVQDLWNSIAPEELPLPKHEQMDELDRRYAEHLRDPSSTLTWEEVKAQLLARHK